MSKNNITSVEIIMRGMRSVLVPRIGLHVNDI